MAGNSITAVVRHVSTTTRWEGPIPPPEVFEVVERTVKGGADRLLSLAENEQAKRLEQTRTDRENLHVETMKTIAVNHSKNMIGQLCATASVLFLVAGCVVCCALNCEKAACALAGCGVVGVVSSFIGRGGNARKQ